MTTISAFAATAALVGEPARAGMLAALMDGRALTASELAAVAGVTPATASGHLAQLTQAGMLAVERQGRHRYHRLASPQVAAMLESLMAVSGALENDRPARRPRVGPRDAALRRAAPATTIWPAKSRWRSPTALRPAAALISRRTARR